METAKKRRPQYCDIVMKGGITSGVVYPLAAVELAEEHGYRFRNVGGTSAGAIAAAAVAAAEYGRRAKTNERAYKRIARLPTDLGSELTSLFQPSSRMRPLFDVLVACIGSGIRTKVVAVAKAFRGEAFAGALPGLAFLALAFVFEGGWPLRALAVLFALLAVVAGVLAAVASEAARRVGELPENNFGLCPGNDRDNDARNPPLTRWLTSLIDELAGKGNGEPLTFGDLWSLDAPPDEPEDDLLPKKRGVNLQMMTTNLSQRRPYSLPFEAGEMFWFDSQELLDFFPRRIVNHMVRHSPGPTPGPEGHQLFELPEAKDLPVVVATRLSLSFPGLICAVPLYAINHAPQIVSAVPERCWFSDGGITSNFPVHFFDAPIPRWPTFAIDLLPLTPDRKLVEDQCENVWLPETNDAGVAEAWVGWEDKPSLKQLSAFGISIFRTAQNWIDNLQMRGAGYRDRIAHVRLAEDEGGMNLKMDSLQIERLAERGACAARKLAERFSAKPPPRTKLSWDNQRWIRYRTYMELLERKGREARRGYQDDLNGRPLSSLADRPPDFPWQTPEQAKFARSATAAQLELFKEWQDDGQTFAAGAPRPATEPWAIPRM
jgi:predicted acylesterase/phospholipase RssA